MDTSEQSNMLSERDNSKNVIVAEIIDHILFHECQQTIIKLNLKNMKNRFP